MIIIKRTFVLIYLLLSTVFSQDFITKDPESLNLRDLKKQIGYPAAASEMGIWGKVILRVLINKDGTYIKHIVLRTPHETLSKACEKEIVNLKFAPCIEDGFPVKFWVNVPFNFILWEKGVKKSEKHLSEAEKYFDLKNYKESIAFCDLVLEKNIDNELAKNAYQLKCNSYRMLEDYNSFRITALKSMKAIKDLFFFFYAFEACSLSNDFKEFSTYVESNKSQYSINVNANLGYAYYKQNLFEKSKKSYEEYLKSETDCFECYKVLAEIAFKEKDNKKGCEYIDKIKSLPRYSNSSKDYKEIEKMKKENCL